MTTKLETVIIFSELSFFIGLVNHEEKTIKRDSPDMVSDDSPEPDRYWYEERVDSLGEEVTRKMANRLSKIDKEYDMTTHNEIEDYEVIYQ